LSKASAACQVSRRAVSFSEPCGGPLLALSGVRGVRLSSAPMPVGKLLWHLSCYQPILVRTMHLASRQQDAL